MSRCAKARLGTEPARSRLAPIPPPSSISSARAQSAVPARSVGNIHSRKARICLRTAGLAASDTWAVGDGQILHYNGTLLAAPRRVALSTSLRGILPGNTTNSLVAVGRAGTVLRLRDNHWACPEHPGPA